MFVDTHAHVFDSAFAEDVGPVFEAIGSAGVEAVCMPNLHVASIGAMLRLEQTIAAPSCHACMGLHPCYVELATYRSELDVMAGWLAKRPFIAIGETGLDTYHSTDTLVAQQASLEQHLAWAMEYDRPLILHARNTLPLLLETIGGYNGRVRGVFHCFTGTYAEACRAIDMGFSLGIGGVLTYKSAHALREMLPRLPIEALVLETDSPYLAPVGSKSRRNTPANLGLIAKQMAKCMAMTVEAVAAQTTANARALFSPFLAVQ